jgi:diguanylate cyclase
MLDIDRFKSLNDQFGHPFGDTVLRSVALLLNESCRSEDVVCRYGGEEFAILIPNAPLQIAGATAERLCRKVASRELQFREQIVRFTASFGVAEFQTAAKGTMLERADEALYQSKATGRNRVTLRPQIRPVEATTGEASPGMPQSVE